MMSIAVPLVFQLSNGDTGVLLYATIGAVFTGAVFGDHCSPLSDTTILASMGAACDHMDHFQTQFPYALTVALVSSILFLITGFYQNAIIIFPGLVVLGLLICILPLKSRPSIS